LVTTTSSLPRFFSAARRLRDCVCVTAGGLWEGWAYELKLDGYRALAMKTAGEVRLRSRNNTDFNRKYPEIARALAPLPDETVVDGEVVALD
jgi:ATP-dependent DNA ligase